ncbi:MAG: hypothetical protein ACRBI6_10510 [Acidimicrobiales bacterium]
MSHMVIFRGPDGKPGYHQTDDIHDAVTFVEQLRNDQGVEQARIFRLEEINFEYRPYYRVELTASEPALSAVPSRPAVNTAPADEAAPAPTTAPEDEVAEAPVEAEEASATISSAPSIGGDAGSSSEDAGVGARRGLFGR